LKSWFKDPAKDGWVIRRLLTQYGSGELKSYTLAMALGGIAAAATAGTAYVVGTVVNQAYVNRSLQGIVGLAVFIIVAFAVKGLAMYGSNVILSRIGYRIVAEIQRQMFDKLLIEGLGYFAHRHSTQFLAKMTRGARSASTVLRQLVHAVSRDLLTLIGLATVMVIQDPIMSVLGFIVMPPAVYFIRGLMRRTRDLARSELRGGAVIYETIQETIRGFSIVKAFTLEQEMRKRVRDTIAHIERKQNTLARLENQASPIMESLGGIAIALILIYGGYRVIELGATPGEFVSFITAFLLAYEPAKRIARLNINLAQGLMAVRKMFDMLDSPPLEPEEPETGNIRIDKGMVRFSDVNFGYQRRSPVLHDLSFTAEAGRMTALVGHSGGGKSTVIALILRFYEPQSGRIEIDGLDIRQIPRGLLRRHCAYVGQDVFLFRGTVRENIVFGKLGASEDEVTTAAKAAYAHDFIIGFPDGYDTQVGEGGARLSSGQRQRIAVARALIRNAPIILLDEATSSLDSKAEREVQLAIDRLREGRTCIAVAHRLHTIAQAHCILVLEHGRIVESGTHAELMRKNGHYASMFRLQSVDDMFGERPATAVAV
jgi:ATP-binding cassette subfamily B protein